MKDNNSKNYEKLAKQIADLMANPDCPENLYNAIADEVCHMSNFIDYNSPEMIEKSLMAFDNSDKKRRSAK